MTMIETDRPDPIDPVELLHAVRPDAATLEAQWPERERAAMRRSILADEYVPALRFRARAATRTGTGHRTLRRIALPAMAAAVAVTFVTLVLPGDTPGGPDPAAAAELRRLAVVAGEQRGAPGRGQYLYRSLAQEQTAQSLSEAPAPGDTRVGTVDRRPRYDTWRTSSGVTYTYSTDRNCLTRGRYTGADATRGSYEDLTGPQLARLSTDPDDLAAFIDRHASGDNRGSANRFIAAGDLVRSGLASPRLRAAALQVLARTDGLTVRPRTRDDRNRPATAVTRSLPDGQETIFFDPATSLVLEERSELDGKGSYYAGVVLTNRIVDRLPDIPRC